MNIIIDACVGSIPEKTKELVAQGTALLNLLACLGYDKTNPPLADLFSRYYQLEGQWLIASPVQWNASHNNVVITCLDNSASGYEQQLKAHFHQFSEHLISEGMALYYHEPHTWLVSSNHRSLLHAKPLYSVLNKPLMLELLGLDETMHWQKFLTESQMFFNAANPSSLMNGVWVWGGGLLGEKKKAKVCTDSSFFALAQLCATKVTLYDYALSITDFDFILLRDWSSLSEQHQQQLEKIATRWYWNNAGYEHVPLSWPIRLWRKLLHAN